MNNFIKHIISISILAVLAINSVGQGLTVTANKDSIVIGEPLTINIQLKKTSQDGIVWPNFRKGDSLPEHFEVLDALPQMQLNNQQGITSQQLTITSFEPGTHKLIPVVVQDKNGVLTSNTLTVKVGLLPADTTTAFKDITSIKYPELTFKDRMQLAWKWVKKHWIILITVILLIIALLITFFLIKKRKGTIEEQPEIKEIIPPHIEAMKDIKKLQELDLLDKKEFKQYYVILTQIIDKYLEGRYRIPTEDKTSREIISALETKAIMPNDLEKLIETLTTADFVKFAKQVPSQEVCEEQLANTIDFIQVTKRASE